MRDDLDLRDALLDVAAHVAYPRARDLSPAVIAALPIAPPRAIARSRRRVLAVAVACVTVLAGIIGLPGPREAVADWLGIRSVQIVRVDQLPHGLGSDLRLGTSVPLDQVANPGRGVVAPSGIERPAAAYVDEPVKGATTLVWTPMKLLPAIKDTGIGLLLTQYPGSLDRTLMTKQIGPGSELQAVTFGGAQGFWISGPRHALYYVSADGFAREDTARLAGNTLLWSQDGVVFRMETALDREAAVALASQLAPLR